MRVCATCSAKTDESGRFCPECGAAFKEFANAETATEQAAGDTSSATRLLGLVIDGQFKIESIIGGGAFGTVYRGIQVGLDRIVAIKVPTFEIAADPVATRRFAREARSAARVHHPSVVGIHAVGELPDGRPYLAMQFLEGQPLDKILADGPLPAVRALRLVRLIANALSETHAAGVVHRDLKPSNVMWHLDRSGDDRVTLVDFGIAVSKPGQADATRLTADGLIGTPNYMSPEQVQGEHADGRADLYALGCILYELVTGQAPFSGSAVEILLAHLGRPAPVPSETNPSVPIQIDKLCAALMQKRPEARPQSAEELVAHLDAALGELDGRPSAAAAAQAPKVIKRPKLRTVQTKLDLPEGTETPGSRHRKHLAIGIAIGAIAMAGAGFAYFELRGKSNTAIAEPAGDGTDNDPLVARRKELVKDNGEMIVHLLVPDPLIAKQEARSRLEIKNKLGQPVVAEEIVLTIADASGGATGMTARPRRPGAGSGAGSGSGSASAEPTPGRYYFRYTFPAPGTYVLRVFPPSIDSSFEIPIEVR